MTIGETLALLNKGYGISRYGDGEYLAAKGKNLGFQPGDSSLARRLSEILGANPPVRHIVAITPWRNLVLYKEAWLAIRDFVFGEILPLLDRNRLYGDAGLTYHINQYNLGDFKSIWNDKKVVFVVGRGGNFSKESKLFDNIAAEDFIYIPSRDAWGEYDKILAQCKKFGKDWIFYIAAGPTATVLAYDLAKLGYQALDLGHLTNSFKVYSGKSFNGP